MPRRQPPRTEEGHFVSHLVYRVSWDQIQRDQAKTHELTSAHRELLQEWSSSHSLDLIRLVSETSDFMTMLFADSLEEIDRFQTRFLTLPFSQYLMRTYSFLSVTELSMYQSEEERVEKELKQKGLEPGTDEYDEAHEERMERVESYKESRLHPEIPDGQYVTFYPMSKRRNPEQNWYQLSREERSGMMASHGRIGRQYAGEIQQIITSCVGLDDWEWGVTLYSDDPVSFKRLVYDMRFDEVSAKYSEFGPFYTGYRMSPEEFPGTAQN